MTIKSNCEFLLTDGSSLEQSWFSDSDWKQLISKYTSSIVIVCDSNTRLFCVPKVMDLFQMSHCPIFEIPAGESSKQLDQCIRFWDFASQHFLDRSSLILAVGGGVVLDLVGFCASVWKRGIPYISIPTSLLAQVDASIGGKTGVNFLKIKNCLGSFYPPDFILAHFDFLQTLPEIHWRNGKVEIIKHLLLDNENPWEQVEQLHHRISYDSWKEVVTDSIRFKSEIVKEDPFDEDKRKILNLGHTIGHAMESFCLEQGEILLHGEAVAAGIWWESLMAKELLGYPDQHFDVLFQHLQHYFPRIPSDVFNGKNWWNYMASDKKNTAGKINFSLLKAPGHPEWNVGIDFLHIENYFQKTDISSIFTV
ncbi:MAG: 3-dehydroquinate synthase [Saprospiraceae bacterium]|nr:3-dehydroquinate synthase [Saprospiraceae bacterium]